MGNKKMKPYKNNLLLIKLIFFISVTSIQLFAQDNCTDENALNNNPSSLTNEDCLYDPFEWTQSTTQSFYVINELLGQPCSDLGLETESCVDPIPVELSYGDSSSYYVIGAKCGENNIIVGSSQWKNEGDGTATVVAMGPDGVTPGTEEYCFEGLSFPIVLPADIPIFNIYDALRDIYYDADFTECFDLNNNVSECEWANMGFSNITSLTFKFEDVLGCIDFQACNYNQSAYTDDGSCIYPGNCEACSGETDGSGVVIDDDSDNDGICNDADTCDGFDDNIDGDSDGLADGCDDCPNDFDNDSDEDGGCGDVDLCDGFDDNIDGDSDGLADGCDDCPNDFDNDSDEDGVCGDVDLCDGFDDNIDGDSDGLADGCDDCPNDFDNDSDGDGVCGDVDSCDGFDDNADLDVDGIADGCDSCNGFDDNLDLDTDGIADGCDDCPNDFDNDSDNDGVCGDVDSCDGFDDNIDSDSDGMADGCDAEPNCGTNDTDCNSDCAGEAYIDLCGFCVGGETLLEECSCEDYEKDCAGNCPGTTYLGNLNEYQYSSTGELISNYLITDEDGYLVLDSDTLETEFGTDWYLGENGIVIGHDCNGECSGNNIIDCTESCQLVGLNSGDYFNTCCETILIDCSGLCGGENIMDDENGCCFSGGIGCDGICYSDLVSDVCNICDGGNTCDGSMSDENGDGIFETCSDGWSLGGDFDCDGICDGDAIEQVYFEDIDGDGLGWGESIYDCSANHFEGDGWVLNNTDEDDNCFSNWHDCAGICDGLSVEDCLGNCSSEVAYIGNTDILDENGLDCNNECDGGANIDPCGECVGGNTNNEPCSCADEIKDCLGNCPEGTTFIGNTGFLNEQGIDCDGVCNGDEYPDCLGSCSSDDTFIGNTGFLDEFGNNFAGDCNGTELPHYIYSFPEEINIPPNMEMSVFIHLQGFYDIPINEVTIDINYPIELFTPFEVVGINSFSNENYLLEYDIDVNTHHIQIDLASNGIDFIIQDEDIIELKGFSGNGDSEFGEFIFSNITTTGNSSILEYLSYSGQIMISDFYVNLLGSVGYYSNGQRTPNVELTLNGETTLAQPYLDNTETDDNGFFEFLGILPGSYLVTPIKNTILDLGSEISSMDASQIARGSVGLIELSAYQQLAADVTLNGNISGLDASKVARYNIGEIDALNESNIHWVFYPEVLDIADLMIDAINDGDSTISADCVYDPNTLGNVCSGGQLVGEVCSELMVNSPECPFYFSIRLGDVTGNWNPSSVLSMSFNRNTDPIEIEIIDNEFSLPIRILDSEEMEGIDISIQYNNELFRLEGIEFLQNELTDLGYNLMYHEEEGNILISSYAMMDLLNIEEFIKLDFSIIDSEFNFGEIQITEFSFNEMESESGFEIIDDDGNSIITNHVIINSNILELDNVLYPQKYQLYQNMPNPFNPLTEISFDIPKASRVSIEIYDIKGENIMTLVDENLLAGHHKTTWDASNKPGGIYFYRLVTDDYQETHKMILLK
jgi:hypothetical protein